MNNNPLINPMPIYGKFANLGGAIGGIINPAGRMQQAADASMQQSQNQDMTPQPQPTQQSINPAHGGSKIANAIQMGKSLAALFGL